VRERVPVDDLGYALPHGRATDRAFPQNDFSRITNFLIADLGQRRELFPGCARAIHSANPDGCSSQEFCAVARWRKEAMMDFDTQMTPKVLPVYLTLAEYPLLSEDIRKMIREALFRQGVITRERFVQEVHRKALRSQEVEGVAPMADKPEEWALRLAAVRDTLTDFYFAQNLPFQMFERIVRDVLRTRKRSDDKLIGFSPELAPFDLLFETAREYEELPPKEKAEASPQLQQIRAVLIQGMISEQMNFVSLARSVLDIYDLEDIYRRRIGQGKIGGKSAGLMLAYRILRQESPDDPFPLSEHVTIPESFFLGVDVYYDFLVENQLLADASQNYKNQEDVERDYPELRRLFLQGKMPDYAVDGLRDMLEGLGNSPIVARSSSLLEDNFGKAFAGKYRSIFCPNQGTLDENLEQLLMAVKGVYASAVNPDALFYRRRMGLVDYNERMAVLIQCVEGTPHRNFFMPAIAGVGFSRNPFRWTAKIKREDGFLRLVHGLGTRAVDRVGDDYPRMVSLSHPLLRPEASKREIRAYSQRLVDVIDLGEGKFKSVPFHDTLDSTYPALQHIASYDEGEFLKPIYSRAMELNPNRLVITFETLLKDNNFITLIKTILRKLERGYGGPVDIEFTVEVIPEYPKPRYIIHLLQCRPLSHRVINTAPRVPDNVPNSHVIFATTRLVPDGLVQKVEYAVFVDPERYARAESYAVKSGVAAVIGRLNKRLAGRRFILLGPGRWGSTNIDLGVRVTYADIFNAAMLIEIGIAGPGGTPELSYGTHFFQDLVESNIFALGLIRDTKGTLFNRPLFDETPNKLAEFAPEDSEYSDIVRVVDVREATGGGLLEVVMNSEQERAIGYVKDYRS